MWGTDDIYLLVEGCEFCEVVSGNVEVGDLSVLYSHEGDDSHWAGTFPVRRLDDAVDCVVGEASGWHREKRPLHVWKFVLLEIVDPVLNSVHSV